MSHWNAGGWVPGTLLVPYGVRGLAVYAYNSPDRDDYMIVAGLMILLSTFKYQYNQRTRVVVLMSEGIKWIDPFYLVEV